MNYSSKLRKISIISALFIIMILTSGCSYGTQPTNSSSNQSSTNTDLSGSADISIKNMAFSQSTITVKTGSTVTWTNNDSMAHTATANGLFDSGNLSKGQTFNYTFTKAGTYDYICSFHPSMKGKIIVQD